MDLPLGTEYTRCFDFRAEVVRNDILRAQVIYCTLVSMSIPCLADSLRRLSIVKAAFKVFRTC